MEMKIKGFCELSCEELYDILKLRVDVFVVEQNCPYHEIDGLDKEAYHLWLEGLGRHRRISEDTSSRGCFQGACIREGHFVEKALRNRFAASQ